MKLEEIKQFIKTLLFIDVFVVNVNVTSVSSNYYFYKYSKRNNFFFFSG